MRRSWLLLLQTFAAASEGDHDATEGDAGVRYADRRHRRPGRDVRPGPRRRPRRHRRAGRARRRQPGPDGRAQPAAGRARRAAGAHLRRPADFAGHARPRSGSTSSWSPRVDATHDEYIVAALEAGRDVITEKPMTIDAPRCRRILDAVAAHRPAGDGHLQLPLQPACTSRSASCSPAARSARSARCTSSGCSTCGTAPTTSAAGTATRPTPAACWCTRRATTSTWSTGGSAPTPGRGLRRRPAVLLRRRAGAGTATPATTTGPTAPPAAADDPFALHLARQPGPARSSTWTPRPTTATTATATSSRPASPSRTTWRCWSATPPAPR